MEPNYRIRVEIYDKNECENIAMVDEPLMSGEEDNVANVYRALNQFHKEREEHEATYYPKEEETA